MAIALVMASLPRPPLLPGNPCDKIQHVLAFVCLAGLGTLAYPRVPVLRVALGLSAFGALIEVIQLVPALHRDSDVLDWVADTIAVAAMILVLQTWKRARRP